MLQQSYDYAILPQYDPEMVASGFATPLPTSPEAISIDTLMEEGGVPSGQDASNLATPSESYAPAETDELSGLDRVAQLIGAGFIEISTLAFNYVSACILSSIVSGLYATLAPLLGWIVLSVIAHEPYASHGGVIVCAGAVGAPILASGLVTIAWLCNILERVYETVFEIYRDEPRAGRTSLQGDRRPKLAHRHRDTIHFTCIVIGVVVCGFISPAVGLPILNKHTKSDTTFSPAQGLACTGVGLALILAVAFVCVAVHNALQLMERGCCVGDSDDE
ncbi:hypothetical protein FOMPIDRAFT_1013227 [Fomitopsis schrenkii]|uniref:Transmembrane protein n=1 Tax=Fomitopsis schrenkii TaxID=2126942 RepID=S8EMQ8_FOMSC|nr:hypothetical protein FOMPIDRAFT_1013227 [Fomitopsis schrenkii]